ncbi:MAG: amino acid ABC transporter substrate-binding protein [Rhodovibrionaceae bacterium]|nr:amino acid ABC transporter substrate-binding protein [Rhodovibrionaceae bacterium]
MLDRPKHARKPRRWRLPLLAGLFAAGFALAATDSRADTLERIDARGSIKLGVRADAPPFASINKTGEAVGYMVDICRAVAEETRRALGRETLKIEYIPLTAENRFEKVRAHEADILCGPTTQTLSRRETVDFSLPTFVDGASVLLPTDGAQSLRELTGGRIGVRAGTTTEEALNNTLKAMDIEAEVVAVQDHFDGVSRVRDGKLDAYFADMAILLFVLQQTENPQSLRIASQQFTQEPYALALARGDSDFRLVVDRALARIYRSGRVAEVFRAHFSPAAPSDLLRALFVIHALPE